MSTRRSPIRLTAIRMTSLLTGIACVAAGCQSSGSGDTDAFYATATVQRADVAEVVLLTGQVEAVNARMLTYTGATGRVAELAVGAGQEVAKGHLLLRLDTLDLERTLREAQADLEVARAVLAEAESQAGEAAIAKVEGRVVAAEQAFTDATVRLSMAQQLGWTPPQEAVADAAHSVRVAQDQLNLQTIGAQRAIIRSLEYNLAFYSRQLRDLSQDSPERSAVTKQLVDTQTDLDRALATREQTLQSARNEVSSRLSALAKAQLALDRATNSTEDPAATHLLKQREAADKLADFREILDELRAGAEGEEVRGARAGYDAALAAEEAAEEALLASRLNAPFDGVVLALYVQDGDAVQSGAQLLYLADLSTLRVRAQANEVDVPKLSMGQPVRITLDAYPLRAFEGRVLALPPFGQAQGGITMYEVEASLDEPSADVRLGMLATVRVIVGERSGVLTVPSAALLSITPDETVVKVRTGGGGSREQSVQIGLDDGIRAEVLSGLAEGDVVLIPLVPQRDPYAHVPIR